MSSVVIQGDTSGSVTIQAPAVSGSTVINLPTITGGSFIVGDSSNNIALSGSRIFGDFSNATWSNRLSFQTSTTNAASQVQILPNGTTKNSSIRVFNNSDPTNASYGTFEVFGTDASTGWVSVQSRIIGSGTYLPLGFWTNGSEQMRIDTAGQVGIGTTPSYPLHIVAATGQTYLSSSTGTNYVRHTINNTSGSFQFGIDNSTGSNYFGATPYGRAIFSDGAYPLGIFTNGTERMRIDSSGNVGIGTSSPRGVAGYTGLVLNNATTGAFIDFSVAGTRQATITGSAAVLDFQSALTSPITFSTNGVNERMRIDPTGNVYIGATSATWNEKLSVSLGSSTPNANVGLGIYHSAGSGYTGSMIRVQAETTGTGWKMYEGRATGGGVLYWVDGTGSGYFASNVLVGYASTTTPAASSLLVSGYVGIGTNAPTSKLTVSAGLIEIRDGGQLMIRPASNANDTRLGALSNDGLDVIWGGAASASMVHFSNGGNVGIGSGTGVPATRLYVSGSAASNNATLTDGATITPDFTQSNNFSVTLGGNRTMANPTGLTAGQSGVIFITQDATGSRTLAWGANWDWANAGVPVLSTAANAIDVVAYTVRTTSSVVAQIIQNIG